MKTFFYERIQPMNVLTIELSLFTHVAHKTWGKIWLGQIIFKSFHYDTLATDSKTFLFQTILPEWISVTGKSLHCNLLIFLVAWKVFPWSDSFFGDLLLQPFMSTKLGRNVKDGHRKNLTGHCFHGNHHVVKAPTKGVLCPDQDCVDIRLCVSEVTIHEHITNDIICDVTLAVTSWKLST